MPRVSPIITIALGASAIFADAAQLPTTIIGMKTVTVYGVQYFDPSLANPSTANVGGNAYDRATDDLGIDKTQSNQAAVVVTPAEVTGDLQFLSIDPTIAAAGTLQNGLLTVDGLLKGVTVISPNGINMFPLTPFVFTPFQRTISYHIISDSSENSANLSVSQVQAIIQSINSTWGNQANITFGPGTFISPITVQGDLGNPIPLISASPDAQEEAITSAAKDPATAINVYFVWALTGDGAGIAGATRAATGDVFIATASSEINRTTAHELGHALGLTVSSGEADYTDPSLLYQLMYGLEGGGYTVTPTQGNVINPVQ